MIHNHPILSLLVLTLAVPFLVSCTTAPKDTTAEDRQAIKAVRKQFSDAFNRGDAAAVAALYTEEAKSLLPNRPMIVGGRVYKLGYKPTTTEVLAIYKLQ